MIHGDLLFYSRCGQWRRSSSKIAVKRSPAPRSAPWKIWTRIKFQRGWIWNTPWKSTKVQNSLRKQSQEFRYKQASTSGPCFLKSPELLNTFVTYDSLPKLTNLEITVLNTPLIHTLFTYSKWDMGEICGLKFHLLYVHASQIFLLKSLYAQKVSFLLHRKVDLCSKM